MRTGEPDLTRIAARLVRILGPDRCLLIGALAVAAHGYPHATDDVDVLTSRDLGDAAKLLKSQGVDTVMVRRPALDRGFSRLHAVLEGTRFDILPELVLLRWDCALTLSLHRTVLKIVDLDGLLRLKLRAGGPQDLMDAAHLLLQHPDRISGAREAARAYHLQDKLDVWLNDPRTREQVEVELLRRGDEGRKILVQLAAMLPRPPKRRS